MLNFVSEKLAVPQKDGEKKFLPQNHSRPKIVENLSIHKVVPKNGKSKTGDKIKRQKKVQQSEKMTKKIVEEDDDVLQGVVVIKIVGKLS